MSSYRFLAILILQAQILSARPPEEIVLDDGSGTRTWEVVPATNTTSSVTQFRQGLVLIPKGERETEENRRVLTPKIHLELTPNTNHEKIAEAAGAIGSKTPHYAQDDLILTLISSREALAQLPRIRNLPGVKSARPLLARKHFAKKVPNDPRFSYSNSNRAYQWHLRNTGQNGATAGIDANVTDVWDDYLGTGVTVAVVDDGIQVAHEDLAPNINSEIDHDWNDNSPDDPTPPFSIQPGSEYYSHGTSVAGIIAARGDNGIGVTGAAPRASLVGLKILAGSVGPDEDAEALAWENQIIDISNNSWGAPDDGSLHKIDPLVAKALEDSVENGRNGKGTIFVWSAGNGRDEEDYANYDGFVNQPETIGIGAVNYLGVQSYYSESGANLVVSAPSDNDFGDPGITTTTITTEGTYTDSFGGTSAAAPLVAGVTALILEANPDLGWRDVQEILIKSARKIDSNDPGWTTNGGGFHFHHGYGAGMIDAKAAVELAKSWTNLGERKLLEAMEEDLDLEIPDNQNEALTKTFEISADEFRIEHVVLTVDIDHTYRGDLEITLESPDGTISQFSEERSDSDSDYDDFPFLSVRHWGEAAEGTWTLRILDAGSGDTGTLKSASLKFHGSGPDPISGFDAWVLEQFTPEEQADPEIAGPLADPDQDDRKNLHEYAFGGNPKLFEQSLQYEPSLRDSSDRFRLRFIRDLSKTDLDLVLESTTSLAGPWRVTETEQKNITDTLQRNEFVIKFGRKRFFRVKISRK